MTIKRISDELYDSVFKNIVNGGTQMVLKKLYDSIFKNIVKFIFNIGSYYSLEISAIDIGTKMILNQF